jgi:hypothetical protein
VRGDRPGPCEIPPSPRALEGASVPLRDLAAPLQALMATRVGREETAAAELARWAGCNEAGLPPGLAPLYVELAMCEEEGFDVPLGWVMAEPSRAAIRRLLEPESCNGEALAALDRALGAP